RFLERESAGPQRFDYFPVLFFHSSAQDGLIHGAGGSQILIARAMPVDDSASNQHQRVDKRMSGAAVLRLHVIQVWTNLRPRIETKFHFFPGNLSRAARLN